MGPVRTAFRGISYTAPAVALLLLAGCGSGNDNGPSGPSGTGIAIVAGNFQNARYGTPVAISPAVKITTSTGPAAGVQVTFTPATGSGSVTGGTATTDANGIATVGSWTLSAAPGVNTLKATAGTLTTSISATAVPGAPASITISTGNNQNGVERSHVVAPVAVVVTDGTYPIRGAQVDFVVTSGGGSLDTPNPTTNADGIATLGAWKLGNTGVNTVTATVRSNTSLTTTFTATAAALQISSFTKVEGDNQAGFYGNISSKRATVEARNQFNDPAEGVVVTFSLVSGGGTIVKAVDTTGANGRAEVGTWRFGSTASQSISASVSAAAPPAPVTFTASATPVPASAFKIEVRYPDGEPSPEIKAAFDSAAAKWQRIVVGDLDDVVLTATDTLEAVNINDNPCQPTLKNQTLDDLVIFAYVKPIDGDRGVLGFATPVYARDADSTTITGCMTFDVADMEMLAAAGQLQATITHEMGHVLGIGTLWNYKDMAVGTCATNHATSKPYFIGSSARQAFQSVLAPGVVWADSMVPLEGDGTCNDGTRDAHPSEAIFKNELMTGYIDQFSNPLSVVSAAFLRDLGMTVNDLAADPYTLPWGVPAARIAAVSGTKLNEIKVSDPIRMLDRKGRVTRIIERH